MSDRSEKPQGYYDEIEDLRDKKDELKEFLSKYDIIEHTNAETNYDYLYDKDVVLEVVNPYFDRNLYIELAGEFTVCFSVWHTHYSPYEWDYGEMKKMITSILNNEFGVLYLLVDNDIRDVIDLGSLSSEKFWWYTTAEDLLEKLQLSDDRLEVVKKQGAVIKIDYWCRHWMEFNIAKESEPIGRYTFPRLSNVRFIVEGKPCPGIEGEACRGSGGWKRYNDEMAYLQYVFVNERDDAEELERILAKMLEDDAKKDGMKRIFVNVDDWQVEFFSSLGYKEVERIDDERVIELEGCIVVFEKTLMKELQ